MIPRIVHQTWETADPTYWIFKRSQAAIKEHMPEWEYRFWTDDDLDRLVQQHYPRFYTAWLGLSENIKRVDVARLLILHQHGGLYCDLDVIWKRDPWLWLQHGRMVSYISTQAIVKSWQFMGNAAIASEPGHPFLVEVVEWMLNLPTNTAVLFHTGPRALGKFLEERHRGTVEKSDGITFWTPGLFDNDRCQDGIGQAMLGVHCRVASWQRKQELK